MTHKPIVFTVTYIDQGEGSFQFVHRTPGNGICVVIVVTQSELLKMHETFSERMAQTSPEFFSAYTLISDVVSSACERALNDKTCPIETTLDLDNLQEILAAALKTSPGPN